MIGHTLLNYEKLSKNQLEELLCIIEMVGFILIATFLAIGGRYILSVCTFFIPWLYLIYRRIFKSQVSIPEVVTIAKEYLIYLLRNKAIDMLDVGKTINEGGITTIPYYRGDDKYKIAVPISRGQKSIRHITLKSIHEGVGSKWDDELMKLINEYAGPSRNFHNIPITPALLGIHQPIVITYSNDVVKEYEPNDIISVTLPT